MVCLFDLRESGEADAHVERPRLVFRVAVPQGRVLHGEVPGVQMWHAQGGPI